MPFRPIGPNMAQDDVVRVLNDNFTDIDNKLSPLIIKDETGTRRIVLGRFPDGSYGLAISKEGEDVITALGT